MVIFALKFSSFCPRASMMNFCLCYINIYKYIGLKGIGKKKCN
jgi:hypothetical protein